VGGPDAEGFDEVKEVAEPALDGRVHAGEKESAGYDARGFGMETDARNGPGGGNWVYIGP
jgi:hypothetical protein